MAEPGCGDSPGPIGERGDDLVPATAWARRDVHLLNDALEAGNWLHQQIGGGGGWRIGLIATRIMVEQIPEHSNAQPLEQLDLARTNPLDLVEWRGERR